MYSELLKYLQASFKSLKSSNSASVVLFSTVAAKLGMNFHASIATSKAAIEGLARTVAAEWSTHQIRVNVLAPSLTDTPLQVEYFLAMRKENPQTKGILSVDMVKQKI